MLQCRGNALNDFVRVSYKFLRWEVKILCYFCSGFCSCSFQSRSLLLILVLCCDSMASTAAMFVRVVVEVEFVEVK